VPDKKTRGISNLPVAIPDIPDAPTVSATNVGTSRAFNNGAATVTISSPTGGLPSSYSITTTPTTTTTTATGSTTITGLSSATSYTATVTPTNVSATGAATTSSAFTATTVPQAPTIGTFTDGGTGTTGTLSFTAGATGGSAITGYTYSTDGTNYSAASGTTSPLSLTGLTVGTYTFYLKATNANGTSLASTGVSGTVITPNSYESISTVTVGSGGSSSVTFSSIPSTYTHLQVRGIARSNRSSATQDWYELTFNSTSTGYSAHDLSGDGSTVNPYAITNATYIELSKCATSTSGTNVFSAIVIDVLDYGNANKYKTVRSLGGLDMNGSGTIAIDSGNWRDTSAISTLTIDAGNGTGFLQYTQFALYGIKGA
jgi:hypothetical protein